MQLEGKLSAGPAPIVIRGRALLMGAPATALCVAFVFALACGHLAAQQQSSGVPTAQQEDSPAIAKKLNNPIAALISAPFQSNFDYGLGPKQDGFRYTLDVQPVVPFTLSSNLNLISRTVLPVIHQRSASVENTTQTGLGDTTQSFWLSPERSKPFVWGLGPVFAIPTGTNGSLGSRKLSIGPTVIALKQGGGYTVGVLAFHVWSVAGSSTHQSVSLTFLQPFFAYTTKNSWTFGINTESSYDSVGGVWSVPIHPTLSKVARLGGHPVSVGAALRCWGTSPTDGPKSCGFRLQVTPVFPRKTVR